MTRTPGAARRLTMGTGFVFALALTFALASLSACEIDIDASFDDDVRGSGTITTETYRVDEFDGVEICCGLDVMLQVDLGLDESVEITIDDNLHEHLDVEVVDRTLVLRPTKHTSLDYDGKLILHVGGHTISRLDVRAGSRVEGDLPAIDEFAVRATTGAQSTLSVDTGDLVVDAETGSDVELSGRADRIDASASTGSRIDLTDVEVDDVTVDADTGSSVELEPGTVVRNN